jgi:FtsH-binding integral membrane protein
LTGTIFGTWALLATITHGLTLLGARYLGSSGVGPVGNCAISGAIMFGVMAFYGVWQHQSFDLIGSVLPILSAVLLYRFVANWFELSEDET